MRHLRELPVIAGIQWWSVGLDPQAAPSHLAIRETSRNKTWPRITVANRLSMIEADRDLVAKFGEPYTEYMASVPRAGLLFGLWRWICQRGRT